MQIQFGAYTIKTHELDNKLSVQITSDLGEITMHDSGEGSHDFPNAVGCKITNPTETPEAKRFKKIFIWRLYLHFRYQLCWRPSSFPLSQTLRRS